MLYSLQYLQGLWVSCGNNHSNYILFLGLSYDHDARNDKCLCKWRSRQTRQTRQPNTSKAHEGKAAQKRATCGGMHLWKLSSLSLKEKHQIVAGTRNRRHNPFPGHQGSCGCSLWTRELSLYAYRKFYGGQDKETLDMEGPCLQCCLLRWGSKKRFP